MKLWRCLVLTFLVSGCLSFGWCLDSWDDPVKTGVWNHEDKGYGYRSPTGADHLSQVLYALGRIGMSLTLAWGGFKLGQLNLKDKG